MKKMYLVISATAVVALLGYGAWRLSHSGDESSVESDKPSQAAQQETNSDSPTLIDGHVVVLPPIDDVVVPAGDPNMADFQLPPDNGAIPIKTEPETPATTTIVLPPSMP
jgi:hypothetical protein